MGQGAGLNFGGGAELVVLNSAAPSGLDVHFFGSNLTSTIYEEIGAGFPSTVELQLTAAPNMAPGNYPVTIEGSSGTASVNYTFTVQVVQYLVLLNFNTFRPGNLNVTVGSTVFWINISGDPNAQYDIIFNTIKVQSPVLDPCPSNRPNGCTVFSYTFTTAGNYSYFCNVYSGMKGTITVTS
jgi:plastocyanin